jgi:predicted esterase
MNITVLQKKIELNNWQINALLFTPDTHRECVAVFTHGYTSHKENQLTWAQKLAENRIPTLIFDLPGHYLGSFNEVETFTDFQQNAPKLFAKALEHFNDLTFSKVILGGHSLGALLAIQALTLPELQYIDKLAIAVGFGLNDETKPHAFETPFYKNFMDIRRQLISPALAPENIFPWIKKAKKEIKVSGQTIHIITGVDDLIVASNGPEKLKEYLETTNQVTLDRPKRLPHHQPEFASIHIYNHLKKIGIVD